LKKGSGNPLEGEKIKESQNEEEKKQDLEIFSRKMKIIRMMRTMKT